jgi:hypothetical protein
MKLPLLFIAFLPFFVFAQGDLYRFKGAIDSAYFYHGELNLQPDGRISGRYKYDDQTEYITLGGVANSDGSWTIFEYGTRNGQPFQNSEFHGTPFENKSVTGTWHKLDGKSKTFSFYFKPADNPNEVSRLCTNPKFFSTDLTKYPKRTHRAYQLTSEFDGSTGSVIWFDQPYQKHFSIDFDFSNSKSTRWSAHPDETADGMCVILFKDKNSYATAQLPVGEPKTFIKDGTGLGVYFNLYLERKVQVIDGSGKILCTNNVETYTEGDWQHASVKVDDGVLSVYIEGASVLRCPIPQNFAPAAGFGIGAATGGGTANQHVKNVTITKR